MYRKWSKTVLVAISVTALAFGIPNSASAQTSQNLDDVLSAPIQKLYAEYRGCVQISVFGSYGSAFECTFAKRQRDDQQTLLLQAKPHKIWFVSRKVHWILYRLQWSRPFSRVK